MGKFASTESESDIRQLTFHLFIFNSSEVESKSKRFLKNRRQIDFQLNNGH